MTAPLIDADVLSIVIEHSERFFLAPELEGAVFRTNGTRQPMRWTGSRAVVFCADLAGGGTRAVRIPKHVGGPAAQRYAALDDHLTRCDDVPLVRTRWYDEGVELPCGAKHPLVTLDWVDGQALDRYVDDLVHGPAAQAHLAGLAELWSRTTARIVSNQIAHGDVHAGNVMVTADPAGQAAIKLVDYDCVWVPDLTVGRTEVGLASFQHPAGAPGWGPQMDAFSNTLVYLSLTGLAADPTLWRFYQSDDRLIFHIDDLTAPAASEVFTALGASPEQKVRDLADAVICWCRGAADTHASLDAVLRALGAAPTPADPTQQVWNPVVANQPTASTPMPGTQVWPPAEPAAPVRPAAVQPPPATPRAATPLQQSWPNAAPKQDQTPPPPPRTSPTSFQQKMSEVPVWLIVVAVIILLMILGAVA